MVVAVHQYLESGTVKVGFGFLLAKLRRIDRSVMAGFKLATAAILFVGVFVGAFGVGCFVVVRKWSKGLLRHLRGFD